MQLKVKYINGKCVCVCQCCFQISNIIENDFTEFIFAFLSILECSAFLSFNLVSQLKLTADLWIILISKLINGPIEKMLVSNSIIIQQWNSNLYFSFMVRVSVRLDLSIESI